MVFDIVDSSDSVVASFDADDLDDGEEWIYCAQDSVYTIQITETNGTYVI